MEATDYSFGVIPVRVVAGRREFLLVQHVAGHWSFPKGHAEKGESPMETALRELREETGLVDVTLTAVPAFEESYRFTKRSGRAVRKWVTYYLGEVDAAAAERVTIQPTEVRAFAWGDEAATAARLTFEEGRRLLDEVVGFWEGDR